MAPERAMPASSGLRTGIPVVLTSFVGRQREAADVQRLVRSSRVVTLTGAAGCGKTRLAVRVADELQGQYADGIHWVELAHLADASLLSQAVARALEVPEEPGRTLLDAILDAIRGKQLLLVLDNCEHLLGACAELVGTLVTHTGLAVLATSREPLSVTSEVRYPLPALDETDAIDLFTERARAILPAFSLTGNNQEVMARICRRLDGLPLAIELASSRVNILTVEEIDFRLGDRLELLPAASHLTLTHHRTLRAALDWSYDLLLAREQVLLRRLSIFAGEWSLAAAYAVCAWDGVLPEQLLDSLSALVDKSLVVSYTLQPGETRYTLLETIRQYSRDKLSAADEWAATHERLLEHMLEVSEETESKLSTEYQQLWLSWLEREHPNIRIALSWSLECQRIEAGLRIISALYQYWTIRDYPQEALAWLDRLLAQADERVPAIVRAKAICYAALLAGFRRTAADQMRYGREAAALVETLGPDAKPALVWGLAAVAHGLRAAGDYENELAVARRIIALRRDLHDPYFLGVTLSLYSPIAMSVGRYDEARAMLDEALPLLRATGNPYRIAMALNYVGDLERCERRHAQAQAAYEASVSMLREIGATRDLASVLHNLGHTTLHLGKIERASSLLDESMALQQAQGNRPGMTECLIGFAALAVAKGLPDAGARLLAAAEAIGGPRIASAWAATRKEYEHYVDRARAGTTDSNFQAAQAEGRAFALERAVDYAREVALRAPAAQPRRTRDHELTARERDIAERIGQSKSNGEIADELVMSKRTVEKHIAHILAKLGFTSRAQIVRWAIETGLVTTEVSGAANAYREIRT
jgi:predicted ATPase/DNA-binding CsgD family transcriptional regulator